MIRTRFAPSPTGFVHIGSLRTALFAYLYARKHNGQFVLRIEDTDRTRFVPGALKNLLKTLSWAELGWDEGPFINKEGVIDEKGSFGPYIQSKRLDIYREHAQLLLETGHAYPCFCTQERLDKMRREQMKAKQPPMYDRHCLESLSEEEVTAKLEAGDSHTLRLKVDCGRTVKFTDIVRGEVEFRTDLIDDQVLVKSDEFPTYHLAAVVDDHLMDISHVIRGEEWLSSTPKHILIYEALGWSAPKYAHLPLLLNTDKSKLSKRQGDVSVEDYVKKGYLKDALLNFVALLGWNPGNTEQEVFSRKDLLEKFSLEKVNKSGAVFDVKKLNWINAKYIKKLSIDELVELAQPHLVKHEWYRNAPEACKTDSYIKRVLTVEQERLEVLSEVGQANTFFFKLSEYDTSLLYWKKQTDQELKENLTRARNTLSSFGDDTWDDVSMIENALMEEARDKRGDFLWPLRVALTGEKKSPPPHQVAWVLREEATLERLDNAIEKVSKQGQEGK